MSGAPVYDPVVTITIAETMPQIMIPPDWIFDTSAWHFGLFMLAVGAVFGAVCMYGVIKARPQLTTLGRKMFGPGQ